MKKEKAKKNWSSFSYIKDSMITELTALNHTMMLSIDVIPVPTDEAVREMQNRLLGVETNVTNWQRRQNSNNLDLRYKCNKKGSDSNRENS